MVIKKVTGHLSNLLFPFLCLGVVVATAQASSQSEKVKR